MEEFVFDIFCYGLIAIGVFLSISISNWFFILSACGVLLLSMRETMIFREVIKK